MKDIDTRIDDSASNVQLYRKLLDRKNTIR